MNNLYLIKRQTCCKYSPVRYTIYLNNIKLACVKHTNSVHSEPGSNSYCNNSLKN